MKLDVRLPIGLMFSIFGIVLSIFGFVSNRSIYEQHSLGINVNLSWGIVQLLFGLAMLGLAVRAKRRDNAAPKPNDSDTTTR
jgi:hypothetical protein